MNNNNTSDKHKAIQEIIDKINEQIEWQKEETRENPFAVAVITVLNRVKRKAENLLNE